MKKVFLEAKNRKQAEKQAPWAAAIVKVSGGYMAFESMKDYHVWKNQK